MRRERPPTSPGELLRIEFMEPRGIAVGPLAAHLGCTEADLDAVLTGTGRVSADLALCLGATFSTTPEFWMAAQIAKDLYEARRDAGEPPPAVGPQGTAAQIYAVAWSDPWGDSQPRAKTVSRRPTIPWPDGVVPECTEFELSTDGRDGVIELPSGDRLLFDTPFDVFRLLRRDGTEVTLDPGERGWFPVWASNVSTAVAIPVWCKDRILVFRAEDGRAESIDFPNSHRHESELEVHSYVDGPIAAGWGCLVAFDWDWNVRWQFHAFPQFWGTHLEFERDRIGLCCDAMAGRRRETWFDVVSGDHGERWWESD